LLLYIALGGRIGDKRGGILKRAMCMRCTVNEEEGVLWGVDTMMKVIMSSIMMHRDANRGQQKRREMTYSSQQYTLSHTGDGSNQYSTAESDIYNLIQLEAVDTTIDPVRGNSNTI
jgi:hypothetical protein